MIKTAKILNIHEAAENIYYMVLEEQQIAQEACPGQFLFVRVDQRLSPFLRRPFSIAGTSPKEGAVELLFSVVGEATKVMSRMQQGQWLDLIGPLGSGFKYKVIESPVLLVAGGIGIAPLVFLSRCLIELQVETYLFYGANSLSELLPEEKIFLPQARTFVATEDGSKGRKGKVTDVVEEIIENNNLSFAEIFACGPRPMLHSLVELNTKWKLPMQVSLEERMACGIGACRGCAVEVYEEGENFFKRVCRDGPVFDYGEVAWQDG